VLAKANISRRMQAALVAAGLDEHHRFHNLRHTFGTQMAAAGVPLRTLQEFLGHRDLTTRGGPAFTFGGQIARVIIGKVDMVRLKMDNGPNVVIEASAAEVHRAFQAALDSNEPMKVRTPDGVLAVNPHRVLYLEENPPGPDPHPVVFATLEVTL
jgi:hypothetical protein